MNAMEEVWAIKGMIAEIQMKSVIAKQNLGRLKDKFEEETYCRTLNSVKQMQIDVDTYTKRFEQLYQELCDDIEFSGLDSEEDIEFDGEDAIS